MSKLDELIQELCPNGVEYKNSEMLSQLNAAKDWFATNFHTGSRYDKIVPIKQMGGNSE